MKRRLTMHKWLDVILDGKMVQINGRGDVKKPKKDTNPRNGRKSASSIGKRGQKKVQPEDAPRKQEASYPYGRSRFYYSEAQRRNRGRVGI